MQEKILAAIPQGSTDTVLEVALIQDERGDRSHLELRSLTWSASLGWYRQHTLKLDRDATQALLRTFGYVRRYLEKESSPEPVRKVIPLRDGAAPGRQQRSHPSSQTHTPETIQAVRYSLEAATRYSDFELQTCPRRDETSCNQVM